MSIEQMACEQEQIGLMGDALICECLQFVEKVSIDADRFSSLMDAMSSDQKFDSVKSHVQLLRAHVLLATRICKHVQDVYDAYSPELVDEMDRYKQYISRGAAALHNSPLIMQAQYGLIVRTLGGATVAPCHFCHCRIAGVVI